MLEFQTAEKAGGGYRQKQDEQALRQAGHRYATGFLASARVPGTLLRGTVVRIASRGEYKCRHLARLRPEKQPASTNRVYNIKLRTFFYLSACCGN
jgi:hypothetical protein